MKTLGCYRFMLAVNDPDNGNHIGYVSSLELIDMNDSFEPNAFEPRLKLEGKPFRCSFRGNRLQWGRKRFPTLAYGTWVENWCWDCATVALSTTMDMLAIVHAKGWCVEEAQGSLYNIWEQKPFRRGLLISELAKLHDHREE